MKKAIFAFLFASSSFGSALAQYTNLTVTQNVNVGSNTGHRLYSAGWLQSATYVYAGSYVRAATYLQADGSGFIGNYLRVGGNTNVPANQAVQIGQYATTDSFSSLVVGRYNLNKAKDGTTAPSNTTWNDNDPLFAVGNGTGAAGPDQYRNAFTVYKDGTVTMSKAQGDIGMGQFGN